VIEPREQILSLDLEDLFNSAGTGVDSNDRNDIGLVRLGPP
jgi:hypothetical protein